MPEEQQPEKKTALGGIFNNARKTSIGLNYKAAETKTRKCQSCGAARPDDTDLRTCDFCGYTFMQLHEAVRVNTANHLIDAADWIFINILWGRGKELAQLLELFGIEQPQWETATRHWSQLMHQGDQSLNELFTSMQQQPFTGKYAKLEPFINNPVTIKIATEAQYIQVQEHLLAAERVGIDRMYVLRQYGLNIDEWAQASGYYLQQQSQKMEQLHREDATAHAAYMQQLEILHNRYRQEFAAMLNDHNTGTPEF